MLTTCRGLSQIHSSKVPAHDWKTPIAKPKEGLHKKKVSRKKLMKQNHVAWKKYKWKEMKMRANHSLSSINSIFAYKNE